MNLRSSTLGLTILLSVLPRMGYGETPMTALDLALHVTATAERDKTSKEVLEAIIGDPKNPHYDVLLQTALTWIHSINNAEKAPQAYTLMLALHGAAISVDYNARQEDTRFGDFLVRVLKDITSPDRRDLFLDLFHPHGPDKYHKLEAHIFRWLERCPSPDASAFLEKFILDHMNPSGSSVDWTFVQAASALAKQASPESDAAFQRIWDSVCLSTSSDREKVAAAMARSGRPPAEVAVPVLMKAINTHSDFKAVDALLGTYMEHPKYIEHPGVVDYLIQTLGTHKSGFVQSTIIHGFGKIEVENGRYLAQRDREASNPNSPKNYRYIEITQAVPHIATFLDSPDPNPRAAAVRALGEFKAVEFTDKIHAIAEASDDPRLKSLCAKALGEMETEAADQYLKEWRDNSSDADLKAVAKKILDEKKKK